MAQEHSPLPNLRDVISDRTAKQGISNSIKETQDRDIAKVTHQYR